MNRRKFLLSSAITVVSIGAGGWLYINDNNKPLTINYTIEILDDLVSKQLVTTGLWGLYQIFTHCAQSVEYSMLGYPIHKSNTFKKLVGRNAFYLFELKGKMTHNLGEIIPGAPSFVLNEEVNHQRIIQAYKRFRKSLIDFREYNDALAPHFAYGVLTKEEYEIAHVMHFNNHLQEIKLSHL